jgi:hypothetical protein
MMKTHNHSPRPLAIQQLGSDKESGPKTRPVRAAGELPAPTPKFRLQGNTIDDDLISALNGARMPFHIPAYNNISAGDTITLYLNGIFAGYATGADFNAVTGADITIALNRFQFTGRCVISYEQQDADTQDAANASYSHFLELYVVRADYLGPDPGKFPYPAPVVTPVNYAAAQFSNGTEVKVTVAYDEMVETDIIQLRFDLYANTSDASPEYFYTVPPEQLSGSATGTVTFTVPSDSFTGIDENIGYLYYAVYPRLLVEIQSNRTQFNVDVVPPHN